MAGRKWMVTTVVLAFCGFLGPGAVVRGQAPAADLSARDRAFVTDAAQFYMLQQQFGKLADMNGEREQVKELARRMAEEARTSYEDLRNMASDHDFPVPTNLDEERRQIYFRLFNLSGSAFDWELELAQLEAIERAFVAFDDESRFGDNPDVRGYAGSHLNTLRRERQNAREVVRIPL